MARTGAERQRKWRAANQPRWPAVKVDLTTYADVQKLVGLMPGEGSTKEERINQVISTLATDRLAEFQQPAYPVQLPPQMLAPFAIGLNCTRNEIFSLADLVRSPSDHMGVTQGLLLYSACVHDLGHIHARELAFQLSKDIGLDRKALEADHRRFGRSYVAAIEYARQKPWLPPEGVIGKRYWAARATEFESRMRGWL